MSRTGWWTSRTRVAVVVFCVTLVASTALMPQAAAQTVAEPLEPAATQPASPDTATTQPAPTSSPASTAPAADSVAPTTGPAEGQTTAPPASEPPTTSEMSADSETSAPEAEAPDKSASDEGSRGSYSSQPPFVPDSINEVALAAARKELTKAQAELKSTERIIKLREQTLAGLTEQAKKIDGDSSDLVSQAAQVRTEMQATAISTFKSPESGYPRIETEFESAADAQIYRRMVGHVAKHNQATIDRFAELKEQLTAKEFELVTESAKLVGRREKALKQLDDNRYAIEQAELAVATYEAAGELYIPNVVFPLERPYPLPLINSWGFDRARGTRDSHWHEGIDIFAERGTNLVAAETGVVTKVSSGRLGGRIINVIGDSGTRWYYAHLDGFAPGLAAGQVVEAGEVIGYLGDSGNARGTDPHLHLEVHPPSSRVINPYPQLNVLAQRDQLLVEGLETDDASNFASLRSIDIETRLRFTSISR